MKNKWIGLILIISIALGLSFVGKEIFFSALANQNQQKQQILGSENEETVEDQEINDSKNISDSDQKEENNSSQKEEEKEKQNINDSKPEDNSSKNTSGQAPMALDNTLLSWYFQRNTEHKTPQTNSKYVDYLKGYGYYVGDTKEKVIYLTFDNGYENGYTAKILDVLQANNVKAAFFVTGSYVKQNPDLVKRMVREGHIVGNHSQTHPSMPKISDAEIKEEIKSVEKQVLELTGFKMTYFRPPSGEFSQRTLFLTKELGYETIFWSMAYKDWLVDEQPGKEYAYKHVIDNVHNGAIILLHSVSVSNAEALDSILKDLKLQGYRFASLDELKK
ncbi:MAG TPA: delta-lactam-biosynthetic de-N-acetylase [Clostridia bacterium]|nr:delta-lactam-biosynthetic de-N-acetylase [Clostridia bacterium]